jgi:ABC-type Mn2+/Zn2+ transport system permease subunit
VATAVSLLLLAKCPQAEQSWLNLFKGEIIAVTDAELRQTFILLAVMLAVLGWYRRTFLLISFDPDLATILKVPVNRWNLVLFVLIGLAVGVSVLVVGPLISFGFMLIPPLIAQRFAASMKQLTLWSALIGLVGAGAGFYIAYVWDLPVGPASVGLLGAGYALAFLVTNWRKPATARAFQPAA